MSAAHQHSIAPSVSNDSDTAMICELSSKQTVTWAMPRATCDLVIRAMDGWRLLYGHGSRAPKPTVDRMLHLLETAEGCTHIRLGVTRTVKQNDTRPGQAVRGHSASGVIHDCAYREWVEGPRDRKWVAGMDPAADESPRQSP